MASVSPYPHVEIGVRDESIYVPVEEENLPLHKPLYMMRCRKGPIGVPVWCPSYTYACQVFGDDTFNPRSKYFSEQAYFLLQTFPMNGAFIMRVAGTESRPADVVIECGVSKNSVAVPQWERDANGAFVLETNGERVPINSEGKPCQPVEGAGVPLYARALESVAIEGRSYFERLTNFDYLAVVPKSRVLKNNVYVKGSGIPTFTAVTPGADDRPDPKALYFTVAEDDGAYTLTPAFNLEAFEAGATYAKLEKFAGGWETCVRNYTEDGEFNPETSTLPDIPAGSTIGDMFIGPTAISAEAFEVTAATVEGVVTYTGANTAAAKAIYGSYVFIKTVPATNVYSYKAKQIPAGTDIGDLGLFYYVGESAGDQLEPQATIPGIALAWRARVVPKDADGNRSRAVGAAASQDSQNFTWYPMLDVVAKNPGAWGNCFAVKFYYDENINTVSAQTAYGATTFTLAPVELLEGDTKPTEIYDRTGQTYVTGVMKPSTYDPESDVDLTLKNRIPATYSGDHALPVTITPVAENFNVVGKKLMQAEVQARDAIMQLYGGVLVGEQTAVDFDPTAENADMIRDGFKPFRTVIDAQGNEVVETFVDTLFGRVVSEAEVNAMITNPDDLHGYMANQLSLVDGEAIPYFGSYLAVAEDELLTGDTGVDLSTQTVFLPGAAVPVYLGGGEDGPIDDYNVERYIRAQITVAKAHNHEYLNDYPRCPFNSIIDTGVSMKTKKAYLDVLSFRDNVVVNLATQATWKRQDGSNPVSLGMFPNGKADDESIGSSLRAYAWLMREDINNGTEACRAKIFLHAGYRADHEGPIASTLWIAMKNAQYLNLDHLDKEPKGLPNAAVECWTDISWRASSEDTKSRCWNAGLNYVQNYGMNNIIHYASVRSVYRYETSVLVDSGVVDALTFTKDIIRRSWAKFAGVTIPAAELNSLIQDDLTQRLTYMINGKYEIAVDVYQTDEDVKLGFCRHVDVTLTSPGTNRVWLATVIVRREGFTAE